MQPFVQTYFISLSVANNPLNDDSDNASERSIVHAGSHFADIDFADDGRQHYQ